MKVLITGITGQDGPNMIDYLLQNTDHEIIGTVRTISQSHKILKEYNNPRLKVMLMDLIDEVSIVNVFKNVLPDYFINFAANSFVGTSWLKPKLTFMTNTIAIITILEAIREYKPECKFYSAGSSEEFGDVLTTPQTLSHPLKPRSPYGASKCAARHIVKVYRESYNLFAIHCVLFNHEGIRRGKEYVTRKITSNLARIKHELENNKTPEPFQLGNINVERDWSDSEDFVEAIWLMLNKDTPKEYILSSNIAHSIKDFINEACKCLELKVRWEINDDPLKTKLYIDNFVILRISKDFYRPADIKTLRGDSRETLRELNWKPKSTFKDLVKKMIDYDYKLLKE